MPDTVSLDPILGASSAGVTPQVRVSPQHAATP